ncbi:class II aldolase/adducin family protein [Ammoniphilus sp. YIM 78166]|uniref:class II aldolase/adducin family protein n=1 Tax=Ammoniphilus sp. YIM 78166 TaxID=1644106 RepID=UPI0014304D49|nr:class II aldolase/adducin family protein [Ammoniphilus sp. YIM 78166]
MSPVDTDIQQHKRMLAKAVRMLERIQLLDMNGHVSFRIPGTDCFIINSRKASRASITVEDVAICNLDGIPLSSSIEPPSEVHIHSKIYQKRKNVGSIIHGHPHYQTVLGIADVELKPVFGIGAFVEAGPLFENASLVNTPQLGEELAEVLGNRDYVQLRNHGNVVIGEDIPTAFARAVYLEENAKKQYYASLLGKPLKVIEGENLLMTKQTSWSTSIVQKVWRYYEEKAEKEGTLLNLESKAVVS